MYVHVRTHRLLKKTKIPKINKKTNIPRVTKINEGWDSQNVCPNGEVKGLLSREENFSSVPYRPFTLKLMTYSM